MVSWVANEIKPPYPFTPLPIYLFTPLPPYLLTAGEPVNECNILTHSILLRLTPHRSPGVVLGDGFEIESSRAFAGDVAFGGLLIQSVELKQDLVRRTFGKLF